MAAAYVLGKLLALDVGFGYGGNSVGDTEIGFC